MPDVVLDPRPDDYSGPERRRAADALRRKSDEELLRQVALLEEELEQARHELVLERAELRRARAQAAAAAHQLERVKNTISFRLGHALVRARTWRGLSTLPRQLAMLARDSADLRRMRRVHGAAGSDYERRWRELFDGAPDGVAATVAYVESKGLSPQDAGRLLADLAKARRAYDPVGALDLGRAAVRLDRSPAQVRWLALLLFDAGVIGEAAVLAAEALEAGQPIDAPAEAKLNVVLGLQRVRGGLPIPSRRAVAYPPRPRSLLYVAASSLPHHVSGYTTRTHNLVTAIRNQGWDAQVVTRPGYPWDRSDAKDVDGGRLNYMVGDLAYGRLKGPPAHETPLDVYVDRAATALTARLKESRAGLVHAASNHVNGLPALIAARRAGVPFVYTVRGLWELTTAARNPEWEHTERFALQRDLETLVAREADLVLTLTDGLRRELIQRGVPVERIRLAPNCVDVEQFQPAPRDEGLAARLGLSGRFVVGFLGSLIDYEGLDHLLEATAIAVGAGLDIAVLIVGDGPAAPHVREQARQLGLGDRVVMTGRVLPTEVPAYYSLVDVAAFPRKPFQVCEIVSPLKPLEAMAAGKAVIASDVAALAEMVRHDETGLLFRKGDSQALAETLVRLAGAAALTAQLGANARAWVARERTWTRLATIVTDVYEQLLTDTAPGRRA